MPFGLICDTFHRHPKRSAVALEADGMLARAISYCAEHLTDGFVPADFVDTQLAKHCTVHGYGVRRAKRESDAIVDAITRPLPPRRNPLFHRVDGGFLVHDYLEINRSRAEVEADRAKGRGRVRKHRDGKGKAEPGGVTPLHPVSASGNPQETITDDQRQDHARAGLPALVAEVQAVFGTLGLVIEESSVENAVERFPGVPHVQVARGCAEACRSNRDKPPGLTLHRWFEREAAHAAETGPAAEDVTARRAKALRDLMDGAA